MDQEKKNIVLKLGANIRMRRVEKNYSMEKLALESDMEYSQIRRIEKGIINTTVFQIHRISKALQIPMVEIFHDM